jgi:hypothetical protein
MRAKRTVEQGIRERTAAGVAWRATVFRGALAGLILGAPGCGSARSEGPAVGSSSVAPRPPVDFAFDSIDDRPVTSAAMRGKVTVLAFVTTGSLMAQAQVDFLVAMAKRDGDHVNYALVALETPENRELVELYAKTLLVPFPVAMAGAPTLSGGGPFGDVTAVPVTAVLDRAGRVALRVEARVAKSDELRSAMRGL